MNGIRSTVTTLIAAVLLALPAAALAAGMLDLPRTGQTRCYDTAGKEIACAGTGQDAELRIGAPLPVPRFKDNLNGTVTDKVTGLIWLKNANCAAVSPNIWSAALTAIAALADGACGLSDGSKAGDWRLPNRNEMRSIIDRSKVNPALPVGHPFANVVNSWYKTSTTYIGDTNFLWVIDLGSGLASGPFSYIGNYKYNWSNYVWPVRGGQ